MAWLLVRYTNKLFTKHLRQFHRSANAFEVPTLYMDKEKKAFQAVWPEVMNSLITSPTIKPVPKVGNWVKQLLDYTMSGGTHTRGLIASVGYRVFEDPENFSEDTQHLARILGWCMEMIYILLVDDIIDSGSIRRGKPCWYLQLERKSSAINDTVLIYLSTMELLEMNFGKKPYYNDLMRLVTQTMYRASIGEHLDCASSYNKGKNNIDLFNLDYYNKLTIIKTSFYWYRMPILAALLLVKNGKEKATEELDYICLELGKFFQVQDDYVDTYGNETFTGKVGRDIQEGKCSWLAVTALQGCNEEQRAIFKEFYGSEDPEHVKQIKQLYNDLHLPQVYKQHQRIMYDDLVRRINGLSSEEDTKFLLEILDACYTRRY